MARDLGEREGDDDLPECDDRPAPEEDASDRAQAEGEEREDARSTENAAASMESATSVLRGDTAKSVKMPGRRRDVAEGNGERAEQPERAPQLLAIPEAGELGLVGRGLSTQFS